MGSILCSSIPENYSFRTVQDLMLSSSTSSRIFRCVLRGNLFAVGSSNSFSFHLHPHSFIEYLRDVFHLKKQFEERLRKRMSQTSSAAAKSKASLSQKVNFIFNVLFGVNDCKVFICHSIKRQITAYELNCT